MTLAVLVFLVIELRIPTLELVVGDVTVDTVTSCWFWGRSRCRQ
jgi:hypothetical protein